MKVFVIDNEFDDRMCVIAYFICLFVCLATLTTKTHQPCKKSAKKLSGY